MDTMYADKTASCVFVSMGLALELWVKTETVEGKPGSESATGEWLKSFQSSAVVCQGDCGLKTVSVYVRWAYPACLSKCDSRRQTQRSRVYAKLRSHFHPSLLISQRDHRIDAHRTARRYKCSQETCPAQDQRGKEP